MRRRKCINSVDIPEATSRFLDDVLVGLQKEQKKLPPKYFYDARGSELFNSICTLKEYYIPRTEISIMKANIDEIVGVLGKNVVLIECGCGNCTKTRKLLSHLQDPAAYIPVDISFKQLKTIVTELALDYPDLEILPVCADYSDNLLLPVPSKVGSKEVVYFPGSSISNFEPDAAVEFLKHARRICGKDGGLLIGVDLKKDSDVLNLAYNDGQGVTSAFNLNILERINRELDGDFQLKHFQHHAFYNQIEGRVEMHLVSLKEQVVHLDNLAINFSKGESIWTENSYKYDIEEFKLMADTAGFILKKVWTDEKPWFSVMYLT
ncbi:MAG: L-histidine N(alpha)-methyltransferase [Dehalococcoidia bacterium]|nr:MAG: L-histidine N(alpha)-methyltransferase [Dehalococcoidia bacterium]